MTNRDRDIRVAKAIGWTEIQEVGVMFPTISGRPSDNSGGWPDGFVQIPHFTTDMSAAWKVVEKLRAMGWEDEHMVRGGMTYWMFENEQEGKPIRNVTTFAEIGEDAEAIVDAALQILEAGE